MIWEIHMWWKEDLESERIRKFVWNCMCIGSGMSQKEKKRPLSVYIPEYKLEGAFDKTSVRKYVSESKTVHGLLLKSNKSYDPNYRKWVLYVHPHGLIEALKKRVKRKIRIELIT